VRTSHRPNRNEAKKEEGLWNSTWPSIAFFLDRPKKKLVQKTNSKVGLCLCLSSSHVTSFPCNDHSMFSCLFFSCFQMKCSGDHIFQKKNVQFSQKTLPSHPTFSIRALLLYSAYVYTSDKLWWGYAVLRIYACIYIYISSMRLNINGLSNNTIQQITNMNKINSNLWLSLKSEFCNMNLYLFIYYKII